MCPTACDGAGYLHVSFLPLLYPWYNTRLHTNKKNPTSNKNRSPPINLRKRRKHHRRQTKPYTEDRNGQVIHHFSDTPCICQLCWGRTSLSSRITGQCSRGAWKPSHHGLAPFGPLKRRGVFLKVWGVWWRGVPGFIGSWSDQWCREFCFEVEENIFDLLGLEALGFLHVYVVDLDSWLVFSVNWIVEFPIYSGIWSWILVLRTPKMRSWLLSDIQRIYNMLLGC